MNELEERARTLLTVAADTVNVAPGAVPAVRRAPVWPWLAAAAAVALVAVGLPMLLSGPDRGVRPQPVAPTEVTVPQTYLMTTEQAEATLRTVGLEVRYGTSGMNECELPNDRVVRSEPAAGSVVAPGDAVRIDRPGGSGVGFCVSSRWDLVTGLLDLARFGESDLEFAPEVRLWRGPRLVTTVTEDEATAGRWGYGSALEVIAAAASDVSRTALITERLGISGGTFHCGGRVPSALAGRQSTPINVSNAVDGQFGCAWLRVYRVAGEITDVVASRGFRY